MSGNGRKILYLCADSGISYWGTKGSSIHIRELAATLQNEGCDITVIARQGKRNGPEMAAVLPNDLPWIDPNPLISIAEDIGVDTRLFAELADLFQNQHTEKYLSELDEQRGFDILYERYSLFSVVGLRFARAKRIPFVLEVNSPLVMETFRYRRLKLVEMAKAVEKYLFGGADHIVAVSEELKKYILKIAPDARVSVVPNGVTVERFEGSIGGNDPSGQADNMGSSEFTIGFMGSLKPWHGLDILIDSFAELARENGQNRLIIIGGKERAQAEFRKQCLKLGLDDRVIFQGAVVYEEIPRLLQKMDVLVAPYPPIQNFYFSALKIFEYMAAGKPIVASRIGQISRILTHEKTALLIPPGDKTAMRDALQRLQRDPELRRRLGENARLDAIENHTWKQRAGQIMDIFSALEGEKNIRSGSKHADTI